MQINIEQLKNQLTDLENKMQDQKIVSDPSQMSKLGKSYAEARDALALAENLAKNKKELDQLKDSLKSETDEEMILLAEEEVLVLEDAIQKDTEKLQDILNPKDPNDKKDIILEIRAGTGGDESALFAADLFRMYSRLCESLGFKMSVLSENKIGIGGFKEVIAEVTGKDVYKFFKYESGVHRVQRVPETEKAGRIHTSAATVAVMPQVEEVDLKINPKDLRIDTFCASGHGGQSVNTTYSAVRITHLPTNIVATCQDEKSQGKNKDKAMAILRARILDKMEQEKMEKERNLRQSQVGSGDRSEKIRTYNFPQDRITDHRIRLSLHNLPDILNGNLLPLIEKLQAASRQNQ